MDANLPPILTYYREGHLPGRDYSSYEEPRDTIKDEVKIEASSEENK